MLDAAEELFREGGSDALTVEAVIERAGTSTGSFYARFGNRRGLFVAMHERFLDIFGTAVADAAVHALTKPTRRESLHHFFAAVFTTVRDHRNTLYFHMIQNAHVADMRAQGNELTKAVFAQMTEIAKVHASKHEGIDLTRIDMVGRILQGLAIEMMLFEPDEVTGHFISDEERALRLADVVDAYL